MLMLEEQSIRLVMSPNAREKTFPFMGILETRKKTPLFLLYYYDSRKILSVRERERFFLGWKNYEIRGRCIKKRSRDSEKVERALHLRGEEKSYEIAENVESARSLSTDSPDYRSNYLARHDRATPSSGDGIAVPTVLRVTAESDHPPPPRSLLRRYYPLVRSSSQFRLGTTATISATPVTALSFSLSRSIEST